MQSKRERLGKDKRHSEAKRRGKGKGAAKAKPLPRPMYFIFIGLLFQADLSDLFFMTAAGSSCWRPSGRRWTRCVTRI